MKPARGSGDAAFSFIDLVIVLAVLLLAFTMVGSGHGRGRTRAERITCVCNLKQVGLAFRTWAMDHTGQYPMAVSVTNGGTFEALGGPVAWHFRALSNELVNPRVLFCPSEAAKKPATTFGAGFSGANITYFLALNASDAEPEGLLAGDDNLLIGGAAVRRGIYEISTNQTLSWSTARHVKQGNVGLADGSVQQLSSSRLNEQWAHSGQATNRLAFP